MCVYVVFIVRINECCLFRICDGICAFFVGKARVWRERSCAVGQRAHVSVGARAELTPAWFVQRGDPETKAEAAYVEESWLRSQLQGEACVPARGLGAAEEGAAARGGAARSRERRHAQGAGGARGSTRSSAALRPQHRVRRRQHSSYSTSPQHRLRHHHSEESTAKPWPQRARGILGMSPTGNRHTHTHKHVEVQGTQQLDHLS